MPLTSRCELFHPRFPLLVAIQKAIEGKESAFCG